MKLVFVILAAMVAASAAQAQDEAASAADSMYWRFGAGASFVDDWSQDYVYNPNLVFIAAPPTGQTVSNGTGYVAAAALGFDYADGIRTEFEYRYAASKIDGVTIEDIAGPTPGVAAKDHIGAHFVFTNFYFDFPNKTRFAPFIGAGVGGARVDNAAGDSDLALAWQGRGGVSTDLGGGYRADLEYLFVRSNKLAYGPKDDDFTADGPAMRIDGDRYQSSSVMLSLRKPF